MNKLFKLILTQPMRLVITITLAFVLNNVISITTKQLFLSISLSLKELLMFMIPLIIFSSVYAAFAKIRGHALLFTGLLLACVVVSNFFSVNIAGIFSYLLVYNGEPAMHNPQELHGLEPLWQFSLPKLISNNLALLLSLVLAYLEYPIITKNVSKFADVIHKIVEIFLKRFFIPALPLFIFGFLIKLLNDNIIGDVVAVNPKAFILMIIMLVAYLSALFTMAIIFYRKKPGEIIRNLLPPALTAFTTMSSAAALPFSIKAAESNTGTKNIADVVMPATVNIHMIGDTMCIPILAMILLAAFGHPMPDLAAYLVFALMFTITKFSGAGVPGGSIMVMIPVLESYLGFTPEMVALITICYMLIDPITTTGNVVGNNLFVIHFNKLYGLITRRK